MHVQREVPVSHVELSLLPDVNAGSLELWAYAVARASEPCVVLDTDGAVVAASPGCRQLLGIDPVESVGLRLVDEVLRLLDFNAVSGELRGWEVDVIPPLLAIRSGGLARGLVRVSGGAGGGSSTVDAVSTPLKQGGEVVGSLTFFNPVL
jgi:PAS domain-containing protein